MLSSTIGSSTPAFVNDDVVDLSIRPTAPGQAARIEVRPDAAALSIVNSFKTGAPGSNLTLELDPEVARNIGTPGASAEVKGAVPIDQPASFIKAFPMARTVRIANPSNYARSVFFEALEAQGVEVDAQTVAPNPVGKLPVRNSYARFKQVAKLVGTPVGDVARLIMKVSYNLGAGSSARLSTEWSWSAISKNPKPTTRTARASQTNIVDEARTSRAYQ